MTLTLDDNRITPDTPSLSEFNYSPHASLQLTLQAERQGTFWIALETPGPDDAEFMARIDSVVQDRTASTNDKITCMKLIAEASFPELPEHQALGMAWLQEGWERTGILTASERSSVAYAIAYQAEGHTADDFAVEDRYQLELKRPHAQNALSLTEKETLASGAAQKRFPFNAELASLFYDNCFGKLSSDEKAYYRFESEFHFAELPEYSPEKV